MKRDEFYYVVGLGMLLCLVLVLSLFSQAENSPVLNQRFMEFNEASPNVTFNNHVWLTDGFIFPRLTAHPSATDPVIYSSTDGDLHIIPVSATGEWETFDNQIAQFKNGGWSLIVPATGWVMDATVSNINDTWREGKVFYTGSAWETIADATTQTISIIADVTSTQKRFYDITYSAGFVVQVSGPGAWMEK